MTLLHFAAAAVVVAAVLYVLISAARSGEVQIPWAIPAALSLVFAVYTVLTIAHEGLFGFWVIQTENLWGLQVWVDLIFAVVMAWMFLAPEAKKLGMPLMPWAIFVASTATIGLWAMVARVLYLKQKSLSAQTA